MRALRTLLIISLVIIPAALSGCKPSYPGKNVTESVLKIIEKEYGITGDASLNDQTLYLDIRIPGMVTAEQKALPNVIEKAQGAVLAVTRVALSSDADIRYVVITASDPSWAMSLRFIQRIEDVKGYLYQRISRGDYEERLIVEMDGKTAADPGITRRRPLDIREFIGRLIVSRINMLIRGNPFMAIALDNASIEYHGCSDNELAIKMSGILSSDAMPFLEQVIIEKSASTVSRMGTWRFTQVRVIQSDNTSRIIAIK